MAVGQIKVDYFLKRQNKGFQNYIDVIRCIKLVQKYQRKSLKLAVEKPMSNGVAHGGVKKGI